MSDVGPPKTVTPSLQRWGHRRKGAFVFRGEDRCKLAQAPGEAGGAAAAGPPSGGAS